MQAAFTLDTKHCSNIQADGATLANVGSDKQISYTVLPGKGLDAEIDADVTDFEMNAVSVNGVQLSLNVEIDGEELMDKVREIMDATETLNQGAGRLADGAKTLETGGGDLVDGVDTLYSGVTDLDNGMANLQAGVANMQQGLNTLNSKSDALKSGSGNFLAAMQTVQSRVSGISVQTDQLAQLTTASGQLDSIMDYIGGEDKEVVSFASDKNVNTTSVQFVIKTSEIKKVDPEPVSEKEGEKTGFTEKLANLFGK